MASSVGAQRFSLNGYVKDMQIFYQLQDPISVSPTLQIKNSDYNLVHNRLNFSFYPSDKVTIQAEIRNRIFSGSLIKLIPEYSKIIGQDNGLVDLSWNIDSKSNSMFFNSTIDRLYFDFVQHNWQLRIGRQRINWGINLVWNPNDLFNTFSFIDFDYEERPGSDAILFTWYPDFSSSVDIAYKPTSKSDSLTLAAKYRFNLANYDYQIISAVSGYDFVIGGGWSGNIQNMSFRGEISYFMPMPSKKELSEKALVASVSTDYTFSNGIYLHGSFLYNSLGNINNEGLNLFSTSNLSAKQLSYGKYEVFGQISYPLFPILNAGIASIINLEDQSFYFGPTLSCSVQDNWEIMTAAQFMIGDKGSEYGALGNSYAYYVRLRWSF